MNLSSLSEEGLCKIGYCMLKATVTVSPLWVSKAAVDFCCKIAWILLLPVSLPCFATSAAGNLSKCSIYLCEYAGGRVRGRLQGVNKTIQGNQRFTTFLLSWQPGTEAINISIIGINVNFDWWTQIQCDTDLRTASKTKKVTLKVRTSWWECPFTS